MPDFLASKEQVLQAMLKNFDHVTIAVRDLEPAIAFFKIFGFEVDKSVVISGEPFSSYMGVDGLVADHVTLAIPGITPHFEIQLLHYQAPEPKRDPSIDRLDKLGFNHICFAVDDADATVAKLKDAGVVVRSELKDFHDRKLYFVTGPEGVTIELAEWHA